MINFGLKQYEWQKSMNNIMQNVNLNDMRVLYDGTIEFDFLNSHNGDFYKKIRFINVWKVESENNIEKGEYLPFFICDIFVHKLKKEEIASAFSYLRYGFNIPDADEYHLVCMESGDISLHLLCESFEIC